MKKLPIFIAAILFSTSALADVNTNNGAGNVINDTTYSNAGNSGNSIHQSQDAHSFSHSNSNASSGGNSLSLSNSYQRQTASSYAPAIISGGGNDSCLGSISGGASTSVFGMSLGGTTTDENCVRLKNNDRLESRGYHKAALYVLCQNQDIRDGMMFEKEHCPQGNAKVSEASERQYPTQPKR